MTLKPRIGDIIHRREVDMRAQISRLCCLPAALTFTLAIHISAQDPPTPQTISTDPQDWPMYNHDSFGTRWNRGESVLSVSTVSKLHEKWRYLTAGDVYAPPAVVDNVVYLGDSSGVF